MAKPITAGNSAQQLVDSAPQDGKYRLLLEFDPVSNMFTIGTNCNAYPLLIGLLEWGRTELDQMLHAQRVTLPPGGVQG